MIVIAGKVAIKPERRAEVVQVAREMAEVSRREAGCVAYEFSVGIEDQNVFFIFEEWATEDALARHFQTEHMAAFQRRLPGLLAGRPALKRYVVSSASPM
jgi:quinol monooxygenase YgiN